jgi:AcrR family transcriptional regulator
VTNRIHKHGILLAAVELAAISGYASVTRDGIADRAGVAMGTVTNKLGTMKQIRRAIIRHAIRTDNMVIIAQAVVAKDPLAEKIDTVLRRRALESTL